MQGYELKCEGEEEASMLPAADIECATTLRYGSTKQPTIKVPYDSALAWKR